MEITSRLKNRYRYIRVWTIRLFSIYFSKQLEIPNSILILAPHPDDETFGCAGLIQRALNEKKDVKILILTKGEGAYNENLISETELTESRRVLSLNAINHLGLEPKDIEYKEWGDGHIKDSYQLEELSQAINAYNPDAIFTPHLLEGWSDHIATTEITAKLLKDLNRTKQIKLFQYCVWVWYSMPYTKLPRMGWRQSFVLSMNKKEHGNKIRAIREYTIPLTSFGKPFSGVLPKLFIKANSWKKELYFELK